MKSVLFRSIFLAMTIISIIFFVYYLYVKHGQYDIDTINEIIQNIGVILLCIHYSISYSQKKFD